MLPDYRVRQRDYLLELSRSLTEELDLNTLLTRILSVAVEMLGGHAGFIALDAERSGWHIAVSQNLPPALTNYIEGWITSQQSGADDSEERIPEIDRMLNDISMGMITGVGILMTFQHKVIGQIYVFRNYRATFTANDRSILSSFANQAAIAVRNARLYNQTLEQSLRMAALLDSVADGIIILEPNLTITRANTAFERMMSIAPDSLVNKPFNEVIRWQKPPLGLPIEEALATNWRPYRRAEMYLEGDLQRGDGLKPLPVTIKYAPLFSAEGELLNIIADVHDITRFRTAEEMKSSFISVVSHELKTPIALIKGYASTLRRDDANWDLAVVEESLGIIEDEADHLTAMVEDLLDATRLQSGGLSLKPTELNLADLTAQTVKRFATQTVDHAIKVDFTDHFPAIVADEERMRQVLSNLIGNALKYTHEGEIWVRGRFDSDFVQICVQDQGKGFDPIDLPFVFERFYRSEDAARMTKGTGLGLYLCKEIIKAHGGTIWIDETYKQGARICFSVPRHPSLAKETNLT
ncbi:MAG: GAF domain-containing sensor histidine kinase [Anaerolineaceae bacterium]